ncbi:MAG: beta-N-acetylhexosaminidase [Chitinophagaceae bacterium]
MKLRIKKSFSCILLFSVYASLYGSKTYAQLCPIVPKPISSRAAHAVFELSSQTFITYNDDSLQKAKDYLTNMLIKQYHWQFPNKPIGKTKNKIVLRIVHSKKQKTTPESYTLSMSKDEVHIQSSSFKGIIHGVNSLLQLVYLGTSSADSTKVQTACWNIKDAPRYGWRSFMLDESRHFFGKQTVKTILDVMALYKLNKFHWHLTDETGWRIQINQYPLLTSIGATGDFDNPKKTARYYTQSDIREIVAYASERGIDIVPEIDMPGHASAAVRAYPIVDGGGSDKHPNFTFNPGLDTTYTFLTNILKEVAALFPSKMIHIGGDEVSFGNEKWTHDSAITVLKKEKNLASNLDVEHYFIHRMADSVKRLGCKVLGWDELADTDLDKGNTVLFWWRHDHPEQVKKMIEKGYPFVACPRLPFYFDFVQTERDKVGRRWDKKYNPIENVYSFTLDSTIGNASLLGVQAAAWTEQIASVKRLHYMTFPRLLAMAENAWTPKETLDFSDFSTRMDSQMRILGAMGVYYYDFLCLDNTPEVVDSERDLQYLDNAK